MAEARCHYCTRVADEECSTCGRLYCAEHGEDVCLRCLSPEAATPSVKVFRGALLALAIASFLTIFLLIRPPESKSSQDTPRTLATPTPAISATATPTRPGSVTRTATPSASAATTATAAAGTTPGAGSPYVVKAGESLSVIAENFGVSVEAIIAANPGLSPDNIRTGQTLTIPPRP